MPRLFVNNLTVIDFSYLDSERGVVGESWIVDIELIGGLDDQGMVFDFGSIKKQIKQTIDAEVDHRLLVPLAVSGCRTGESDDSLSVEFPLLGGGMITHRSPRDAVLLVDAETIDANSIASELEAKIKAVLPDNVSEVRIGLRTEDISDAYYHYTHGLQKHDGQCQRIAHGHRSRLEVYTNGQRDPHIEHQWANRLQDSYIATECHILDEFEFNGIKHTRLAYTARQGDFAMTIPSACLFTMPMESTVENIANYLAQLISKGTEQPILVKAYEGLDKGAFGEVSPDQ